MVKDKQISKIKRRRSRVVKIGELSIGGDFPIAIQAMVKKETKNIEEVIHQIGELKDMGAQIVRLAVKDFEDAKAIKKIKKFSKVPLVADIHFDWRLALKAIENGIDKIRLNPGNIYKKNEIYEIVRACKLNNIPIRVGLNSGSLPKINIFKKDKSNSEIMVKSALEYIHLLESFNFFDIVVSLKSSDIFETVSSYRKLSKLCDYPLHLGLTATGPAYQGIIKSTIAIGALLLEGIGDTIRVSLTDKPEEEVRIAKYILESLNLDTAKFEIISCPTCGRCQIDLIKIVKELENKLNTQSLIKTQPLKIAVMGCVVNGPGEAREADLGIAFGKKDGLLFKKGKPYKKVDFRNSLTKLLEEIKKF